MGSTKHVQYQKSTLVDIKSKGNYWFVVCTKPQALRKNKHDKAIRRSTKTREYREATRLWDKIEKEIYQEFDAALNRDPFMELADKYWNRANPDYSLDKFKSSLLAGDIELELNHDKEVTKFINSFDEPLTEMPEFMFTEAGVRIPTDFKKRYPRVYSEDYKVKILEDLIGNEVIDHNEINEFFRYLNYDEAIEVRYFVQTLRPDNPYPLQMQTKQREVELTEAGINDKRKVKIAPQRATSSQIMNQSGCPSIGDVLPEYMLAKKWNHIRDKTKKYTPNYINKCLEIIGNLPLDQVQNFHANDIAKRLDEEGKANSTIKNYVNSLGGLLAWATTNVRNKRSEIEKPWVLSNVFMGVSLEYWGAKKREWEALETKQLMHLFSLEMSEQERLILTLLITTGMRLDEVCLLRWEQIKKDKNGIRFIDLSVTSREVVRLFLEQLRFDFVPVFHGLQGRFAA